SAQKSPRCFGNEGFFNSPPSELRRLTLVWTLAGVLFAARVHTALQADALTATARGDGEAGHQLRLGGELAICFGDDFVAHGRPPLKVKKERKKRENEKPRIKP
ncbi:MAG: hypothetical protein KA353_08210, partial [Giesbergeria sp.]|nr:hypothetical protein [Giesbergeria sp.]